MDFELYINWGVVGIIILIALVIALLAANIKVVPQAHAFVIERLGAYHATWSTGLHLKIPFIDRIAKKVSLKEQVIDFPPQPVITKDNDRYRSLLSDHRSQAVHLRRRAPDLRD